MIKFECHVCKACYKTEEYLRTHLLFEHSILKPICQNHDLIKNRIIAENNLISEYSTHLDFLKRRVMKHAFRLSIMEFYKLISLERKLKAFNIKSRKDSKMFNDISVIIDDLHFKLYGKRVPLDYKIDYTKTELPDNKMNEGIFVDIDSIYKLTYAGYDKYQGIIRKREDIITDLYWVDK